MSFVIGNRVRIVRGPLTGKVGTVASVGRRTWEGFDVTLDGSGRDVSLRLDEIRLLDGGAPAALADEENRASLAIHLSLVRGLSRKFWSIRRRGPSNEVHFGRIGTAGQRRTTRFDYAGQAELAYERLVAEKRAKGYVEADPPKGSRDPSTGSIEDKLDALEACGFRLSPDVSIEDLVAAWGRQKLDSPGWNAALICLGMTSVEDETIFHCDKLWHFDTECIEDNGDYVRIIERMAAMTLGALTVAELTDAIDLAASTASIDFTCNGERVHIDCEVNDDWVDPAFFGHLVRLLAKHAPTMRYLYYDLGGQDCIIGCATDNEFTQLRALVHQVTELA